MRKLLLLIAGLAMAGAGFALYHFLSPPKHIPAVDSSDSDLKIPDLPSSGGRRIGDTDVQIVENSQWVRRDPVTKKVVEVGGFSKLLTPPEGGAYWLVESPYLIRYESRFTCRIDADRGRMQMDQSGNLPTNVELMDKVVLRISQNGPNESEEPTCIYLDNLVYSSERSEFATDGPVYMVSPRAELRGRGLMLIYNPRSGQVDYLEVRDLDTLLVKNAGTSWREKNASDGKETAADPNDLFVGPMAPAALADANSQEPARHTGIVKTGRKRAKARAALKEEIPAEDALYYQCSIQNNVVIQYGRELVVKGADQVNIQRILWQRGAADKDASVASKKAKSGGKRPAAKPKSSSAAKPEAAKANAAAEAGSVTAPEKAPWQEASPVNPAETMGRDDVLITCDGGIIIQPMGADVSHEQEAALPSVEMAGKLHIDRLSGTESDAGVPLASCSALRYVFRDEILELFSHSPQDPILIYLDKTGSMIETLGKVFWDRRANQARVNGPGKVFFAGDSVLPQSRKREVDFAGLMDLEFAEGSDPAADSSLALEMVNLTGGMRAFLHDEGIQSRADQARFTFHPSNKPKKLNLRGDVQFETEGKGGKSQVNADKTVLYFDPTGNVQSANLAGQVRMTSSGQVAKADTADIQFQKGEDGRMVPGQVHLEGDTQIESAPDANVPPTRFEAIQIDYDLQAGKAIATGPVHFTFYTPADKSNSFFTEPVPVDITARNRAEFVTDGNGAIRQVLFLGQVVAQWKAEGAHEQILRRFFGEKLIVDLDKDTGGGQRIRHVSMQDKQVLFESIHFVNNKKVNHVRLYCRQFDYEAASNMLIATGPGKLELNNQKVPSVSQTAKTFSLAKPCFAYMEGFDQLQWNVALNTVLAYGKDGIYLNYWPIEQDTLGDQVIVQCVHAQAQFASPNRGKSELVSLQASGGVEYREEKEKGNYLQGDSLTYTDNSEWVIIEGSDAHPCKVNAITVPLIRYNPQTEQIKTRLSTTPSVIPLPQGQYGG